MVLQGMKEYSRQTFGEEALSLFGDEEGGSSLSSGGGKKKGTIKLKDYPEDSLEYAKLLVSKCKILVYHAGKQIFFFSFIIYSTIKNSIG